MHLSSPAALTPPPVFNRNRPTSKLAARSAELIVSRQQQHCADDAMRSCHALPSFSFLFFFFFFFRDDAFNLFTYISLSMQGRRARARIHQILAIANLFFSSSSVRPVLYLSAPRPNLLTMLFVLFSI
jgi:hypothetical protein